MLYWLCVQLFGPAQYAYQSAAFRAACAILLSFALVWWLAPRVIRTLVRLKIGDVPEFDHRPLNELTRNKSNTPTMGGVLILFAVFIAILLLADLANFYVRMGLFCLLWLGVLGGVDDWLKLTVHRRSGTRDGLRMYEKLLFQVGLGVLLGYFIYHHGEYNLDTYALLGPRDDPSRVSMYRVLMVPFYKHGLVLGPAAFVIITILVIAGTSNAVNLTDGMDGLASGCVSLCAFAFLVLSLLSGSQEWSQRLLMPYIPFTGELAVLCGAIVGACLGFLWYNCYPAQVFMGDTGALPLGGLIGYVAVVIRHELMLLIVGGVFVIEALSVLLQIGCYKFTGGRKRLFLVAPLHHHFHLKGWTETQVVTRFWLVAAVMAAFALASVKLR